MSGSRQWFPNPISSPPFLGTQCRTSIHPSHLIMRILTRHLKFITPKTNPDYTLRILSPSIVCPRRKWHACFRSCFRCVWLCDLSCLDLGWVPDGSDGKESTCQCRRRGFYPWVRKILWKRVWQPTPVCLPWRIPWTEEPGGLQSMGSQRVGHDWATNTFSLFPSGLTDAFRLQELPWHGFSGSSLCFRLLIWNMGMMKRHRPVARMSEFTPVENSVPVTV